MSSTSSVKKSPANAIKISAVILNLASDKLASHTDVLSKPKNVCVGG